MAKKTKTHPDAYRHFVYKPRGIDAIANLMVYNDRNGPVPMTITVNGTTYRQSFIELPEVAPKWKPKPGDWIMRDASIHERGEMARADTDKQNAVKKFPTKKQREHFFKAAMLKYEGYPIVNQYKANKQRSVN